LFILTGSSDHLILYNNLLAACSLIVLVIVVAVPSLSRKYLFLQAHAVLTVGTLVFAIEALYSNLERPLHNNHLPIWDSLGFAVLLFSLGYDGVQKLFASERRLLSIDKELEIPREIQTSILPSGVPRLTHLCVTATYRPSRHPKFPEIPVRSGPIWVR
jgi:hypothetical protein